MFFTMFSAQEEKACTLWIVSLPDDIIEIQRRVTIKSSFFPL
jgi:hypothetical protein